MFAQDRCVAEADNPCWRCGPQRLRGPSGFPDDVGKVHIKNPRNPQKGVEGWNTLSSLKIGNGLPRQRGPFRNPCQGQIACKAFSAKDFRYSGTNVPG